MKSISIRYKIWLTIISVSVFTILLVTIVSYYLYQILYIEKQTDILLKQGRNLEAVFLEENQEVLSDRLQWVEESSETSIIFTDDPMQLGSGAPFDSFAEQNLITFSERQELLLGKTLIFTKYHTGLEQEIRAVVVPLILNDRLEAVIFLYMPLTAITEAFQPIRMLLFSSIVILIIFLVGIGLKMTNRIVRPLVEMEKLAKEIAQGNFAKRVAVQGKDEITSLGKSINTMSENLHEVDKERKEFLGNVSHELRTPISYLKGYSEAVKENLITTEKYIETIEKETDRMNQLVHDLLDLAQLDGTSYPLDKEPVILSEMVKEIVRRFRLELKEKKIITELDLNEEVVVLGDYKRLDQVIVNLLSNAIKFTPENRKIKISVHQMKDLGIFQIEDEGIGIPENDLPYIFERFYRVEKARTRKTGGTGLGLSIVQQIVNKHKGNVQLESTSGRGTKVTVKLPLFSF
ncbi:sensor histidine kinase [Sutcliffiella rhizosphaerae]|uniref:histidine kinase n=1 Tax=Sutcliffiella rhizosphaerae TaxID=2880967 RepID=A0ABM8YL72_9BACI|nr:ATP-binding protein [Sutcliffiella rhizosphaerae]CAG9620687.1 Adaptive-response sensory-kinase SasA [Sutcliffiella rhizosphaerae]